MAKETVSIENIKRYIQGKDIKKIIEECERIEFLFSYKNIEEDVIVFSYIALFLAHLISGEDEYASHVYKRMPSFISKNNREIENILRIKILMDGRQTLKVRELILSHTNSHFSTLYSIYFDHYIECLLRIVAINFKEPTSSSLASFFNDSQIELENELIRRDWCLKDELWMPKLEKYSKTNELDLNSVLDQISSIALKYEL